MASEYKRQEEMFTAEAEKLLHRADKQLPMAMNQIDQLLRIKVNISPTILLFDPQCSHLKARMENLNREAILSIFLQKTQKALSQIIGILPFLNVSRQHFIDKFKTIITLNIPINNWKDIFNKLKDKDLILKNCTECFRTSLEMYYHQQKIIYQVGDNKQQDNQAIGLIDSFVVDIRQWLAKANSQKDFDYDHHSDSNPQLNLVKVWKEKENLQIRQKISNSLRQSTKSAGDKTSFEIIRQHQNNLLKHKHHSSIWPVFHNIEHQNLLLQFEKQEIQGILKIPKEKLYSQARQMLNGKQLQQILKIIKSNHEKFDESKKYQYLVSRNIIHRNRFIQNIERAFKQLGLCKASTHNNLYLVRIIYECFKANYTPPLKRFLISILQSIEEDHYKGKGTYLRGALSEFEDKDINQDPSSMSNFLSKLEPQRSSEFVSSKESKLQRKNSTFRSAQQAKYRVKQAINTIHVKLNRFKQPPTVQFVKLCYASSRKTVTIMISGFFSEDSNKDEEWMQMIHRLRESQLYAYRWASGTVKKAAKYLFKKILNFTTKSTFTEAFEQAQKAGVYLAQFLIEHFSDRFINLVGYSLGTRVIYCCLKHLLQRKKTNLINRVITLGGVADSDEFHELLRQTAYPLDILNLWSNRDGTLKHLLRLWDSNISPIGLKGIGGVPGHTVRDVDLSKIVTGHLNYLDNQYLIVKMGDIIHD